MAIESFTINRADSLPVGDYRYLERVTNPTTGKLTTSARESSKSRSTSRLWLPELAFPMRSAS